MAALLRSSGTIVSRNLLRSLSSLAAVEKPAATSLRKVKAALISESDPDKLFEIFQKSSDHPRVWRDRTVFDVSVRKLSRSKRVDLIEKMLEHQKVSPVAKTEGFLVRIMMLYSNAGMFDQAVHTFHQMGELGCKRTEKSFCALLSIYLQKGRFDLVHKSFESVPKEIGISPGVSAYNHVLKALCKEKSFGSARSLLEKMEKEKGVTPDTASYNILLGACLENGDETKFNEIVKEMERKGLNPSLVTYNYRISKLVRNNKESAVDDAKKMLDEMVSKNIRPNSDTYVALIRHFVGTKDFDSALGICKMSLRRRYVPPFSSLKDLVNGLVKSSKADEAKKIVENTKELLRGSAVDSWAKIEGLLPL